MIAVSGLPHRAHMWWSEDAVRSIKVICSLITMYKHSQVYTNPFLLFGLFGFTFPYKHVFYVSVFPSVPHLNSSCPPFPSTFPSCPLDSSTFAWKVIYTYIILHTSTEKNKTFFLNIAWHASEVIFRDTRPQKTVAFLLLLFCFVLCSITCICNHC